MTESAAQALAEITTLASAAQANPLYPLDAPLVRVSASGQPDPVIAAIARHITDSGSVFLELPDGRPTVVLHLDGVTWIARRCDEGIRDYLSSARSRDRGRDRRHLLREHVHDRHRYNGGEPGTAADERPSLGRNHPPFGREIFLLRNGQWCPARAGSTGTG
jgi:hypothetical protein